MSLIRPLLAAAHARVARAAPALHEEELVDDLHHGLSRTDAGEEGGGGEDLEGHEGLLQRGAQEEQHLASRSGGEPEHRRGLHKNFFS